MVDKVALVSGANKGIGKEVARQLGKKGFKVLIGSRDTSRGEAAADELRKDGIDAKAVQLDVTSQASIDKAIDFIEKNHGHLDVLVNNAGILSDTAAGIDTSVDSVETTLQTNFVGPLRLLQKSVPLLEKSGAGRVVNVSSSLGSHSKMADPSSGFSGFQYVGYSTSKSALNMLTIIAAENLASKNIKVNAICPGYVATDINNNSGPRSVEQGAAIVIKMATLPEDGPTGTYVNDDGTIPW
ncbi:MAG TPA: SDR family oxidoreductase [Planktothrix sp.]|jgi:NAD(P)-dependent dehydrogenase (short-subunit alcohol dehydrogenase family)